MENKVTMNQAIGVRSLRIMRVSGERVAGIMETVNEEVYSTFNVQAHIGWVQQGQIRVFSEHEEFLIKAGEFYFMGGLGNFKQQRTVGATAPFKGVYVAFPHEMVQPYRTKVFTLHNAQNLRSIFMRIEQCFTQGIVLDNACFALLRDGLLDQVYATRKNQAKIEELEFMAFLGRHINSKLNLDALACAYGKSTSTFYRDFKRIMGQSPHSWLKYQRLQWARRSMQINDLSASEVYLSAGFEDLAHFSRSFKECFGYSPSDTYGEAEIIDMA